MNVPKTLVRFVKQAASLAQKRCAASPTAVVSAPASNGVDGWKHVILHCFHLENGHSYRQTPNQLKYMTKICAGLGLYSDVLKEIVRTVL